MSKSKRAATAESDDGSELAAGHGWRGGKFKVEKIMERRSFIGLLLAAPMAFVSAVSKPKKEVEPAFDVDRLTARLHYLKNLQYQLDMDISTYGFCVTRQDETGFYRVDPTSDEGLDMLKRHNKTDCARWRIEEKGKFKNLEILTRHF